MIVVITICFQLNSEGSQNNWLQSILWCSWLYDDFGCRLHGASGFLFGIGVIFSLGLIVFDNYINITGIHYFIIILLPCLLSYVPRPISKTEKIWIQVDAYYILMGRCIFAYTSSILWDLRPFWVGTKWNILHHRLLARKLQKLPHFHHVCGDFCIPSSGISDVSFLKCLSLQHLLLIQAVSLLEKCDWNTGRKCHCILVN